VYLDPREIGYIHDLLLDKAIFTPEFTQTIRNFLLDFSQRGPNSDRPSFQMPEEQTLRYNALSYDDMSPSWDDGSDMAEDQVVQDPPFTVRLNQSGDEREALTEIISDEEAARLAVQFFNVDLQYMINTYQTSRDVVEFRALIVGNPSGEDRTPLMIIRPDLEFHPSRSYYNDDGRNDIYHADIWEGWKIEAERNSGSERAKLFRYLSGKIGGQGKMEHIYLEVRDNKGSFPSVEVVLGWPSFNKHFEYKDRLLMEMGRYGIDAIRDGREEEDRVSIEKLILETEVKYFIELTSKRLSSFLSSKAVRQYKNLAFRFLTDPNAPRDTVTYQIFMEYFALVKKL